MWSVHRAYLLAGLSRKEHVTLPNRVQNFFFLLAETWCQTRVRPLVITSYFAALLQPYPDLKSLHSTFLREVLSATWRKDLRRCWFQFCLGGVRPPTLPNFLVRQQQGNPQTDELYEWI